jgi:hypothetical protein
MSGLLLVGLLGLLASRQAAGTKIHCNFLPGKYQIYKSIVDIHNILGLLASTQAAGTSTL